MTKQEIIDLVRGSTIDTLLKEMIEGYINAAWNGGFQEGMEQAAKIQGQVFDMLLKAKEGLQHG